MKPLHLIHRHTAIGMIFLSTLLLVLLGFSSCKHDEPREGLWGLAYEYVNRTAEYMWADNLKATKEFFNEGDKVIEQYEYTELRNDTSIRLTDYALYINTCNVGYDKTDIEPDRYKHEDFSPYRYKVFRLLFDKYAAEPDPIIENQLRQHYEKDKISLRNGGDLYLAFRMINYRTTPIKSINVYFSEDLLMVKKGETLNHLLNTSLYVRESYPFIITASKKVIWPKEKFFTLSKYLTYNPMAPSELILRFREGVKLTEPITGKFTVTMEPVSGKLITATTKTITLTP